MAYSAAWSEAVPAGSLAAQDLDQAIRDAKRDIRERVTGLFGMADWSADPLVIVSMKFGVNPATIGLIRAANNVDIIAARNALNTADFALLKLNAANMVEIGAGKMVLDPTLGDLTLTNMKIRPDPNFPALGTYVDMLVATGYIDFRRRAALGGSAFLILDDGTVQIANGKLILQGLSPSIAPLHISDYPSGVAPTTLNDGVMWCIGNDMFRRIAGVTKKVTFA